MNRVTLLVLRLNGAVPRLCGDEPHVLLHGVDKGTLFPAYAGMNRTIVNAIWDLRTVPRLCGDEPWRFANFLRRKTCSPPMRG